MIRDRQLRSTSMALRGAKASLATIILKAISVAILVTCAAVQAQAELDLRNASVDRYDNGFSLILLPDHRFPVVSVQMLYRVGARNEVSGKTGLAHFLEHMAFRDSRNFPDTELVSRIYAVGGEWHGYTWTDQTTYYSTVPSEHLDLLLRIEADRMSNLNIAKEDMQAERGAVLAEMHMYENSPTSMLIDAVNFMSFLAHPYRNNTIGWESDIQNLQHDDVVDFYKQHYQPANAVLAIVGDFDRKTVRKRVETLFGSAPSTEATPLPHTIEPPQNGLRRVTLHGPEDQRQFMIAYRAPSVVNSDFASFLVLQEILGSGSGVSFLQNDWGTAVDSESTLAGAAESLTTWYPPSAQDYVFIIGGVAPAGDDEATVEQRIESRIASLRQQAPTPTELMNAISEVQDALIFDIQTSEDAAHQLAFFDGLNALDTLLNLPELVAAVSLADVQRVATKYLRPEHRSIAWHVPPENVEAVGTTKADVTPPPGLDRPVAKPGGSAVDAPLGTILSGGVPVIVQRSDLSSTALLQIVLPSNRYNGTAPDMPVTGFSSIVRSVRPKQVDDAIQEANDTLTKLQIIPDAGNIKSGDPATRMEQTFAELMQAGGTSPDTRPVPSLITVVGDIDVDNVLDQLEETFGSLHYDDVAVSQSPPIAGDTLTLSVGKAVAQAQLGYIAVAPSPGDPRSDAWRLLLYILSHDYEGRLGKKAISESGLAYYIGSDYRSDGTNAWVTLSTGVDANKIAPLGELLFAELERLASEPPSDREIAEAKSNQLGRLKSSAQSNAELSAELATQWLWHGEIVTVESLRERLDSISRQDILDEITPFISGKMIVVAE